MSFSSMVKNELCRTEIFDECCLASELEAVIKTSGIIRQMGKGICIQLTTENSAFARRVFSMIKSIYKLNPEVAIRKSKKLRKNTLYSIVIPVQDAGNYKSLFDLCRDKKAGNPVDVPIGSRLTRNCCKRAYIRGAFLAGGSVSDPKKTYHLEIYNHSRQLAAELSGLINSFGLNSKITGRKSGFITYLKEGENIADFLNIVYAHNALLKFENIRILKEMRNNVNRLVNCETANLGKTVNASVRQVEKINYIKEYLGFENLPENLREIARLRLEHREASLAELGQMLSPPLGKSGVNHRLRKLEKIAENMEAGKKNPIIS